MYLKNSMWYLLKEKSTGKINPEKTLFKIIMEIFNSMSWVGKGHGD